MLAEIFMLQLEATLRANNEKSTHDPKIRAVRSDHSARL